MQPAVLVGIGITSSAHYGFSIQVVLTKYEENSNQDHKEVDLVVKLEQEIVKVDRVCLEQVLQFYSCKLIHACNAKQNRQLERDKPALQLLLAVAHAGPFKADATHTVQPIREQCANVKI